MGRTEQDVVDALLEALRHVGIDARACSGDASVDAVIALPSGEDLPVQITSTSLVTPESTAKLLRRRAKPGTEATPLVVADRITEQGRQALNQANWNWLDLRGHLRLVGPGVFVDADVPAQSTSRPERPALSGQVGLELAALLLLDPTSRVGVREAATALGRAPSSVSSAFAALRAAGLVNATHEPVRPEMFWELAEHWNPVGADVSRLPAPDGSRDDSVLHLGLDNVESTVGWALTDTVAAMRYDAPVSARADHPPDFYVPDRSALRRATRLLGSAAEPSTRAGRVRVAPTPLVCARRVDGSPWDDGPWPLAHPLFVALDLAQDPGRGREILSLWSPKEPWHRVW